MSDEEIEIQKKKAALLLVNKWEKTGIFRFYDKDFVFDDPSQCIIIESQQKQLIEED